MSESFTPADRLPRLNRDLVSSGEFQRRDVILAPDPQLLDLPEKAVQFGTGAFLRGFVDYFLDEANRRGRFGGRVVMIGSTGSGRDQALVEQDGLYTLSIRGVEDGAPREEHRVIGSVSRAISARSEWSEVLNCARNPDLELIFSNTTEVGIRLDETDGGDHEPPRSFPGKLTRFLFERARAFGYDTRKGLVVIPCELIEDNGDRLREIVLTLAERWGLGDDFIRWIEASVPFCNTLVDRIVPGAPSGEQREQLEQLLGYLDNLHTVCEFYRLFAIQGDDRLRRRLSFAEAAPGVVITQDVTPYRERKVRLLNGTHTVMVPAALLCGCETVLEAMQHELLGPFVRRVMFEEIAPGVDAPDVEAFAREVLDRFSNPFIRHTLFDISLQGTMKLRVRVIPSIVRFAEATGQKPASLAFGFAVYLLFMRGDLHEQRQRAGLPVPVDDQAERIRSLWNEADGNGEAALETLVHAACSADDLWGTDLTQIPDFSNAVTEHLVRACRVGVPAALEAHLAAMVADT